MDDAAIADLLNQSRAAHQTYRFHLPDGPEPDPVKSLAALQRAFELRQQAEVLDPSQTSNHFRHEPEPFEHAPLMNFYRAKLS